MVTLEWGTVLDKNPEKRCYLEEVLPSFGNYTVQVRSFNLIKESPRHGETDFEATLDLNVCTMEEVYKFIEAFEESSFTSLNVHQGDQMLGKKNTFYARRHCQHGVLKKIDANGKHSSSKQVGKNTNCPSNYVFRLKACKELQQGRTGENKKNYCKCLRFSIKNQHNHTVDGGDSAKWHKVSSQTKNFFIELHKKNLTVPHALLEYEKLMIEKHGEDCWFAWSGDRSVVPDKKWVDNLWQRLNLINRGTLNGPDSYIRALQWITDYNKKHGGEFAMVKQIMIEGRMEMIACVVDPFSQRAHGILQQAGDIIAVDATSSLDLQDTKLVRLVTCSPAGGIELGYMLVSHENEETLVVAFDLFKTLLPTHAFKNRGPDKGPIAFLTDDCR